MLPMCTSVLSTYDCMFMHMCVCDGLLFVLQSDSGSVLPGPSLHCQKIARAKWEFLFGSLTEESAATREKSEYTLPPLVYYKSVI